MIETTISTNENLVQDNSSIEYVMPETNPITPVQNDGLIFGQKHNDIDCALCPSAKRACDRAWVTAKQIENWSKLSKTTMWRRLNKLEEVGRICSVSDMKHCKMPTNNGGYQDVQLYNLNVLNQLAMVELDCPVLNDTSKKFSDILSEVETTGSYSVNQQQTQPMMCQPTIFDYARALIAEKERSDALEAQNKALEAQRDEAIRTKAQIGDKKVASAMGTAGALSKKCDRLEKELDKVKSERDLEIYNACEAVRKEFEDAWMIARDWCYNHQITVKINEPKWIVSDRLVEICESYPDRKPQWRRDSSGKRLFPKWACDILDKEYDEDSTFLAEYRIV